MYPSLPQQLSRNIVYAITFKLPTPGTKYLLIFVRNSYYAFINDIYMYMSVQVAKLILCRDIQVKTLFFNSFNPLLMTLRSTC